MRLDPAEITAITTTAAQVFGPSATVRLFGSRADDRRRGGDIDLYIEVDPGLADFRRECDFSWKLQDAIGEQKIDVVLHERGTPLRPIDRIARQTGVELTGRAAEEAAKMSRGEQSSGTPPVRDLLEQLRDDLASAQTAGELLSWSKQYFSDLFPVQTDSIAGVDQKTRVMLSGMLKQYEILEDILERRIFRGVLLAEGISLDRLSPRDIANRLESLGALKSADVWRNLVDLRNSLVHDYTRLADVQAARLNETYSAIDTLIETLASVKDYIGQKSLLEPRN